MYYLYSLLGARIKDLREDKDMLLENVVFREIAMQLKYFDFYLKFWRTQDQNEVDFIINEKQAIEVKFSKIILIFHLVFHFVYLSVRNLLNLQKLLHTYILVHLNF